MKQTNKKKVDHLRGLGAILSAPKIQILGVPEGEQRDKVSENIFENIMVKSFLNIENKIATQVCKVHRFSYRLNSRRNTPKYILLQLTQTKDIKK